MMLITMSISSRVNPELRRNLKLPAISQPLFPQSLFPNPYFPILVYQSLFTNPYTSYRPAPRRSTCCKRRICFVHPMNPNQDRPAWSGIPNPYFQSSDQRELSLSSELSCPAHPRP